MKIWNENPVMERKIFAMVLCSAVLKIKDQSTMKEVL